MESILLSLHVMGAAIMECPELVLSPDEAKVYADATATVASQYNHVVNPKLMAWFNLIMVAGGIYGTRAIAVRRRLQMEATTRPATPQNVVDFNAGKPKPTEVKTPADMFGADYSATMSGVGD